MKKFMAILLALALTALMPAAFAQAADDFGYVDRFTLEDGTELPVTIEHKTNWEYQTWSDTLVAEDIPMYTVTVPEGTENVWIYLTDVGVSAFDHGNIMHNYVYDRENDTTAMISIAARTKRCTPISTIRSSLPMRFRRRRTAALRERM